MTSDIDNALLSKMGKSAVEITPRARKGIQAPSSMPINGAEILAKRGRMPAQKNPAIHKNCTQLITFLIAFIESTPF